jgi:hypothetical protein
MNRFERDFEVVFGTDRTGPHDIPAMRVTLPSKHLTDPDFQYRPSCNTDLSETFRRVRENRKQKTF